jgi:hypothetical protein
MLGLGAGTPPLTQHLAGCRINKLLHGIFNDAVSSSDYTASNGRIISKHSIKEDAV